MPSQNHGAKNILSINLSGNQLLPQNSYLSYAKLNDIKNTNWITLPILKDRIEKHPFVASAEIEVSIARDAKVYVHEKNLAAILLFDDQTFILSDQLQLLPLLSNTKFMDLPIINNPQFARMYKVLDYLNNEEIIEAHHILYALKTKNEDMFKNLSEINLNNGKGITLIFSGIRPIIKFGRGNFSRKILSLNSIWDEIKNVDNNLSQSDYVDLRFPNQIYLGKAEETVL